MVPLKVSKLFLRTCLKHTCTNMPNFAEIWWCSQAQLYWFKRFRPIDPEKLGLFSASEEAIFRHIAELYAYFARLIHTTSSAAFL
jgi:hypothetical protein